MQDIITLPKSEYTATAQMFARAFFNNPTSLFCLPDESKRAKKIEWFIHIALRCGQEYGIVHTTPGIEGAAIWLQPSHVYLNLSQLLKQGFLQAPVRLGFGPIRRLFKVLNLFEKLQKKQVPEKHWYLFLLAVDPRFQGRGIGSRLIQPVLERTDGEMLSCYLETDKPENVSFFQKNGFRVLLEDDIPKGGYHFWTMKRGPKY
jgi:ribosomal protein S18 acetylase RimI-like enzyme